MVKIARETTAEVFVDEKSLIDNQTIASEDFSEFSSRVPGVFMFLGTGNKKKGTHTSHHNPCFNIDEDTMPAGVEMYVKGAFNFFKNADDLTFLKRR
jgi:amidohydrolase